MKLRFFIYVIAVTGFCERVFSVAATRADKKIADGIKIKRDDRRITFYQFQE